MNKWKNYKVFVTLNDKPATVEEVRIAMENKFGKVREDKQLEQKGA